MVKTKDWDEIDYRCTCMTDESEGVVYFYISNICTYVDFRFLFLFSHVRLILDPGYPLTGPEVEMSNTQ